MNLFCYLILALASCAISCTAADLSSESSQHIDISEPNSPGVGERSDDTTKRQYIIVPNNAMDNDTNVKTEVFLKSVTQQPSIHSAKDSSNGLIWWLAKVTDLEVYTIRKNPGEYSSQSGLFCRHTWL